MVKNISATEDRPKTSEPIHAGANAGAEFLRIPDVEKLFGVKRGLLYHWISSGTIRSINVRKRGAKTGLRLIDTQSLRAFLLSQAEGGHPCP
ncbi:MAG: hypothetical protein V4507_08230 [Verrucomicrobiota bacterium]